MLSDNQHIDDFFRQKEEAFSPDNLPVEANWQQFKTQLNKPGGDPDKLPPGNTHTTWSLGLWVVAVVVLLVAINPFRHGKQKITTTTKQQTTIVNITNPQSGTNGDSDYLSTIKYKPLDLPDTIREMAFIPAANKDEIDVPIAPSEDYGVADDGIVPPPPDEEPDATQLLQSFFQQLEKPEQEFYINTDRDTTLVAKEGTRLFVPAHTLINKAGPVKIIVREYYKYEDIIAAKLTTTSNGEQLVTGGMVHISAEQDGQPVVIAPQKAITVNIPTNNYDDSMKLFVGQEQPRINENSTNLNWLPVGPFHQKLNDLKPTIRKFNLDEVEPSSVRYGKKTTAKFLVAHRIEVPKTELIARLKQRFGSYYDIIKIRRARRSLLASFYEGKPVLIDSTLADDTIIPPVSKTLSRQDSLRYDSERKDDSFFVAQQTRLRYAYSFALTNFGWYNCDKFSNDRRPKVDFITYLDKGATAGNHICLLVFNQSRSVVQGVYSSDQKDYFHQIPIGESAVLVTVAVTAGKVVSSIHPVTVSATPLNNLTFTPTTPEQFKQQLQSLLPTQKKQ